MHELTISIDGIPVFQDKLTDEELAGWQRYAERHGNGAIPFEALARLFLAHFRRGVDLSKLPLPKPSEEQTL